MTKQKKGNKSVSLPAVTWWRFGLYVSDCCSPHVFLPDFGTRQSTAAVPPISYTFIFLVVVWSRVRGKEVRASIVTFGRALTISMGASMMRDG